MRQNWSTVLASSQVAGAALTAAARASALPAAAKVTLPPNFLEGLGQHLFIKAWGQISSVITTPGTARFDVQFSGGSIVVFDGLAVLLDSVAAHSAVGWELEIDLSVRVLGTAAALAGTGRFVSEVVKGSGTMPLGSLVAMLPWNSTPANGATFDSTVSQQVDLFFTQTVATGSMTLLGYTLESRN